MSEKTEHHSDKEETNEQVEEHEPTVEFKPVVKLQEVEVVTHEEDENVLFKM